MHSIPNYGTATKDNDKFAKFPAKHHDKHPKYAFNDKNFPKLQPANTGATTTTQTNQKNTTKTTAATASATTGTPNTTTKKPFDLKAFQAQIEKNMATDFTKLLNAKMEDFQTDIKESLAKIDHKYDDLSSAVTLLQNQQQHIFDTLKPCKTTLRFRLPPAGEMGAHKCPLWTFLQTTTGPSPPLPRMTAPSTPITPQTETKDATHIPTTTNTTKLPSLPSSFTLQPHEPCSPPSRNGSHPAP